MNSLCFGLESPWFFFAATAQIIIIVCFVFACYKHLQTNMASTSSPTSSPTTASWKHDVFLSFRGTDTRYSFTSHLYKALQENKIDAFIDKQLDGGEKLEPALLERIEYSYISVVVFTKNYADSTFCLRELSKIHECMKTKGQKVLPVFHQLDPSQVQDLTGSYGEALSRHERDCASEEVKRWRLALKEIANLKGWDSSVIKDETELIEKIVSDIQSKLHHAPSTPIDAKGLVGIQSRVKDIESSLSFGSTGVLIVGIWGMGGIGKSTTAEAVYNRNSQNFEGRCFFRDVREKSDKHGVGHVRQEILGKVLKKKDLDIDTTELPPDIKRMLKRKKVLIVLDDVNDTQHLNFLVGEDDLFGEGSRIIVTSRDRQVLINACQANRIYKVNDLDEDDALRLFSFHAFKQNNPPNRYTKLSKDVVSCVKGIPLVLEVLGASLYERDVVYWENKVEQLRTNGGEDNINKCLEMCYDELDRTEKKIFLDIACFFGRCTRDDLQQTLDRKERSGIDRLIDMCLIKIVENEIWMHDVLLKLGRDIVTQENDDPRKRSRLWDADTVSRVLTSRGSGKVESISVYLSETTEINASPAAFEGMYNLRLLRFYSSNYSREKSVRIHLPQGLHSLSNELRILDWSDYPLKSFPSDFFPEKLVVLGMPRSELEQLWEKKQPLKKLKLMNLNWSSKLILSDFDFSNLPNLEVLNLGESEDGLHANNLCTLPPSIGSLSRLVELDLSFCSSLTCLPDSIDMTAQMIEEICDRIKTVQISDSIPSLSSTTEETINSEEESVSNRIRQVSPTQGPTLPILQKIICLSDKIQNLKKEHSNLSDQVKTAKDSFLGPPNILDTLQKLGNEYELLRKKYLQELSDRKRLYNEVIELKGNIRVFCRCRPLNQVEITNGSNYVVEFDSSQDNELQIISSDSSKKQFKFDHVFEPEDNQEAVFAQTKPIVASVLDGYNVCIFAYGQTGTGKTFTMEGSPENRGVNYRTLDELFRLSQERSGIMRYAIFVSMMEVYNEKIRDLLIESSNQPPKKLEIKQTAEGTQEVPGLVETRVTGTEDVWDLLKSGSRARSVGSTSANELSSRSHCLLRVTVKGENLINGQKTRSHLWMVDLAGSERVGKIDVEGERLKESQFINKSLSALGDVISALASKTGHIPYRNSKLTHMLQSSLGGDCKTLMFVQISPSATDLGETLCSLNFASRVRGIESGPARKQADLSELFKYKQMVEKLKHDEKETKKLQDSLQSLQLRLAARDHICRTLQEKVRELENQLGEERKTRLKQETRAFAAAASQSTIQVVEKRKIDKKPPLCPSKLRMPLRKITNSMPPPSPPLQKQKNCSGLSSMYEKENNPRITTAGTNTKRLMKPRRMSVAIRPPPPMSAQVFQPKRRVSMATYRSEPTSNMTSPLQTSRYKNGNVVGRQSFVRDPRKPRNSKLFSPLPGFRTASETTPTVMRTSSKFMGSPPTQAGSWKPKHPTVVALQRKSLVWSPLKLRSFQNRRASSLLPYRPSSTNEVQ